MAGHNTGHESIGSRDGTIPIPEFEFDSELNPFQA